MKFFLCLKVSNDKWQWYLISDILYLDLISYIMDILSNVHRGSVVHLSTIVLFAYFSRYKIKKNFNYNYK